MANIVTLVLVVVIGALVGWWLLSRYLKARGHADLASQGGGVVIGVSLSVLTVALFIQFSAASASVPASQWSASASSAYSGDWVASSQTISTTVYRDPSLSQPMDVIKPRDSVVLSAQASQASSLGTPKEPLTQPNPLDDPGETPVIAVAQQAPTLKGVTQASLSRAVSHIPLNPETAPAVALRQPQITPQLQPAVNVSVASAELVTGIAKIMRKAEPEIDLASGYCRYLASVTRLDREVGERFGYAPSESLQPNDELKLRDSTYYTDADGRRKRLRYDTKVKILERLATSSGMTYGIEVNGDYVGTFHAYDLSWYDSADQFARYEQRRQGWRAAEQAKSEKQYLGGFTPDAVKRKLGSDAGQCEGLTTA